MDFGPLLMDSGPIVMDSGPVMIDSEPLVEIGLLVEIGPLVEIVPLVESGWPCLRLIIFKWLVKNIVVTFDEVFNFCQSLYYVDLCLCDVVYCCL